MDARRCVGRRGFGLEAHPVGPIPDEIELRLGNERCDAREGGDQLADAFVFVHAGDGDDGRTREWRRSAVPRRPARRADRAVDDDPQLARGYPVPRHEVRHALADRDDAIGEPHKPRAFLADIVKMRHETIAAPSAAAPRKDGARHHVAVHDVGIELGDQLAEAPRRSQQRARMAPLVEHVMANAGLLEDRGIFAARRRDRHAVAKPRLSNREIDCDVDDPTSRFVHVVQEMKDRQGRVLRRRGNLGFESRPRHVSRLQSADARTSSE
jgi:hypothetical protein